jgi:hypothetical protein
MYRTPQPKNLLPSISSANTATIRIDNFEFQPNASERTADDKYNRNSFRIARHPGVVAISSKAAAVACALELAIRYYRKIRCVLS